MSTSYLRSSSSFKQAKSYIDQLIKSKNAMEQQIRNVENNSRNIARQEANRGLEELTINGPLDLPNELIKKQVDKKNIVNKLNSYLKLLLKQKTELEEEISEVYILIKSIKNQL